MTFLRTVADPTFGESAQIGPFRDLKVSLPTRVVGGSFARASIDTSIWTTSTANGGTAAISGGELALETNTTADGSAGITTVRRARYMSAATNYVRTVVRHGDTGVANNVRRWGAFDANNGCFFELSGTTFRVVTRKATVDTAVAAASFNGIADYALDTNIHRYEIYYTHSSVWFLIDDAVVHKVSAPTSMWTEDIDLPLNFTNTNSGGSTTDVQMFVRTANIARLGNGPSRPRFANINSAGTTVLRTGSGTLQRVIVNDPGTTSTFTLYDNTSAAGTVIAVIDTSSGIGTLTYDLDFSIGLTVVASATPGDITVVYD